MTEALTPLAIVVLVACIAAETAREVGFKAAALAAAKSQSFALGILTSPFLWLAFAVGAAEFVLWIVLLQRTPLAIAYPIISLAYVGVPLAGVLLFREVMSRRQWFGAALIAAGVACVGVSGLGG